MRIIRIREVDDIEIEVEIEIEIWNYIEFIIVAACAVYTWTISYIIATSFGYCCWLD